MVLTATSFCSVLIGMTFWFFLDSSCWIYDIRVCDLMFWLIPVQGEVHAWLSSLDLSWWVLFSAAPAREHMMWRNCHVILCPWRPVVMSSTTHMPCFFPVCLYACIFQASLLLASCCPNLYFIFPWFAWNVHLEGTVTSEKNQAQSTVISGHGLYISGRRSTHLSQNVSNTSQFVILPVNGSLISDIKSNNYWKGMKLL